ncbi:right-handed parallel beta-helix repeat-containing protein [Jiangella alkaliphila]|uniref:Parallel beta-helix repeat (Two copies) n=1 Tax=Jiangella alkaliphila TaxID=419479 RepID=A0A1H2M091_9ACTN|nr:right-handed parallel beta-helix repeat-containing protein [Jiangella alkaliphila]SDU85946.1 parallel beta-helix repeat (two copies) [Jiangella alkaliphila]
MSKGRAKALVALLAAIATVAGIIALTAPAAQAGETFVLTSTTDAADADVGDGICLTGAGECTLRAAIQESNASTAPDVIQVAAGTYELAIAPEGDNGADTGDLDITAPVTVNGAGAAATVVDGGDAPSGAPPEQTALDRVLEIHETAGAVTLSGLTLREGFAQEEGGALYTASGGNIRLNGVNVTDSEAIGDGGGIYALSGTVTITGGALTGNTAHNGGGVFGGGEPSLTGVPSRLNLSGVTVDGNSAMSGGGVFIDHEGALNLTNTPITDNHATDGDGGGVVAGSKASLSIRGGAIEGNTATGDGGGVFTGIERPVSIEDVAFTGNEAGIEVEGVTEGSGGGLFAGGSGPVVVESSTFTENSAGTAGGGIALENNGSVNIENTEITGNHAEAGGGLLNAAARVTVTGLTIMGNEAELDGGGILSDGSGDFTISETMVRANTAENGGGLANEADGALRVESSTFWDNRAIQRFSDDTGLGGGIYGLGDAAANYENVTITGNIAQVRGGGLYIDADADVHVGSTTIAHNSAPLASGVGGEVSVPSVPIEPSTSVIFRNTIVSDNLLSPSCNFAIGSEGGNIENGDSCHFRGARDRQNASTAGLDAVADNGGPTMTMALREESFAIDGGVEPCPTVDQRGVSRPQGNQPDPADNKCDSGAFEYEGPFAAADSSPPDTAYVSGPTQDTENTSLFTFTGIDDVTPTEELLYECRLLEFEPGEPPEPPDPTEPLDPEEMFVGCPNPWQVELVEDGIYLFEVRAIDRAGNVDPTPDSESFEFQPDGTAPNTVFQETPSDPSDRNSAAFTFTGTDDRTAPQFLEFECRIDTVDPDAWLECFNPAVFSNLAPGEHTVQVRAIDGEGNIDPTPATHTWTVTEPSSCTAANIILPAAADTHVEQGQPLDNFGASEELVVRSNEPDQNARSFVRFTLPDVPDDCVLERATLRLHGEGEAGRSLEAVATDAAWDESQLNWNNQPGTAGAAVATSSGAGYREWTMTGQVQSMLDGATANNGWTIRDSAEGDLTGAESSFISSEAVLEPPTPPQLVLRFQEVGTPEPPAPPEPGSPETVTCGQVITESTRIDNDLLCLGEGLVIGAPNIVLDLNGHTLKSALFVDPGAEEGLHAGVRNAGHANVDVRNGTIEWFGYGVRILGGGEHGSVHDLTLTNNLMAGVELHDADDGRYGVHVHDNVMNLNGDGVAAVFGTEGALVEGNTFGGNLGRQVYLFDSGYNRVEGNTVSGLTHDPLLDSDGGIYLESASDNVIAGNTVSDTGDAAMAIHAGSHRNTVEGNTSSRSSDSAISVDDSDGTVVTGNVLHLSGGAGISLSNAHHGVVSENDARFNPGGIALAGSHDNEVTGNEVSHTGAEGIGVESSHRNVISGNVADHGGGAGIAVTAELLDENGNPIDGNVIEDNEATGNLADGIAVDGGGHEVTANEAYNNAGWGITADVLTIDGGGNLASGNAEPEQCEGVVCAPGTAPPVLPPDLTAPDTQILTQPANGASSLSPQIFTFTGTDNLAPATALRFECRLDAPPDPPVDPPEPGEPPQPPDVDNWVECGSPQIYPFLLSGEHTFEVRAIDPYDNVDLTPATYTWNVVPAPRGPDDLPPSTTISSAPDDPSTETTATFAFRGSDNATPGPFLTYECRLDGGAWAACVSPAEYPGLSLGEHTFEVRARDVAGNTDPTPAVHTWTIETPPDDTTDPETTIDSGPDVTTVDTSATFTFSSNEAGATFECKLDTGAWAACTSPAEFTGLAVGGHELQVRATDTSGNVDESPASYLWTVTAAPVQTTVTCGQVLTQSTLVDNDLTDCAGDGLVIGAHGITVDLDGRIIDGVGQGTGIRNDGFDSVTVRDGIVQEFDFGASLNSGVAQNIVDGLTLQSNITAAVQLSNADDGTNGNTIRNNEIAGNAIGVSLLAGTQDASITGNIISGSTEQGVYLLNSSGNTLANNQISATSNAGVQLDGSSTNVLLENEVATSSDAAVLIQLGSHGNRVEGNTLTESEAGVIVLESNGTEIVGNAATTNGDVGISLETAQGSLVQDNDVRYNTGGIALSGSSGNHVEANNASDNAGVGIEVGDTSLSNVLLGNIAIANDGEGIAVNTFAPPGSGTLVQGNTANSNAADGIAISDVGHMIGGNVANNNGGWGIYAETGSVAGINVDGGGNRAFGNVGGGIDPVTQRVIQCFNIDCDGGPPLPTDQVPPDTSIVSGPSDPTTSTSATITFTGSDNATTVTFECRLDGGAWAPCTNPVTYTGLGIGEHLVEVRATDWTGNVDETPAQHAWTVEPPPPGVAPETTIDSGPDAMTVSTTAVFTFSSNEEGVTFQCKLDGLPYVACTSPATYTGLSVGAHTLLVRATDGEGNVDATPAEFDWTVGAPPVAAAVSCGQTITQSTLVTNDLAGCSGDGLIIGAAGITLDLGGHLIEGSGQGAGVRNSGFDSVAIVNGSVTDFDFGVQLGDGVANNVVASIHSTANQDAGIALAGTDAGNTVRTSTVNENVAGIVLSAGTTGAVVLDNTLSLNPGDGIRLDGVSGNRVEGNLVTGSSESGIALLAATGNTLLDNQLSASSSAGISLEAASDGNVVQGNSSTVSGSYGISVMDSSDNEFVANTIGSASGTGLSLDGANDSELRANDVRFNAGGIALIQSSGNLLQGNNASGTTDAGISLESESFDNVVRSNTAGGNNGEGIYVAGQAQSGQGNLIESNNTSNNGSGGILVNDAGHTVTANVANSNDGWGIFAHEDTVDGGQNHATGNAEPAQCFNIVCIIGPAPGAPDTEIVDKPADPSSSRNALFTFIGTDDVTPLGNLEFQCRLDSEDEADWVDCENPQEYTNLSPGPHKFDVRAVDENELVDASPASYEWEYVPLPPGVAPDTTINLKPPAETPLFEALFTFTSNEPDVTFECAIDDAEYSPCFFAVEHEFDETEVGQHTFRVRATDSEGLTDPTPAEYTWTITGVLATITDGPAFEPGQGTEPPNGGETEETTATFVFEANVADSTFDCSLDFAPFAPCTSPMTYTGLSVGEHVFRVFATDPEGVSQLESTEYEWTVVPSLDTVPPNAVIQSGPADPTGAVTFTFTGTDNVTTPAGLLFECSMDSAEEAAFSECTSPWTYPNPEAPEPLEPGGHVFYVRAVDAEDNIDPTPASLPFTFAGDSVAPAVTILTTPPATTPEPDVLFTFSANDPLATFECSVDGAEFEPCESPFEVQGMLVGPHELQVRAVDMSGNTGAAAVAEWTMVGPPETTLLTTPDDPSGAEVTFTFEADVPGSTFTCALNAGPFLPCASPHTYSGLGGGDHAFQVAATSPEGFLDESPAEFSWTVDAPADTTAPDTVIESGPPPVSTAVDATFTFSSPDPGAGFQCALDGGAFGDCPTPYLLEGVAEGPHQLSVRAVDVHGNTDSTPAAYAWEVDGPPEAEVTDGPPEATESTSATFEFVSDEPGSTFVCFMDGLEEPCTSPVTYTGLTVGAHLFAVRATDANGNVQPDWTEHEWTVTPPMPPQTMLTSDPPPATTSATTASFAFSSNEPGTFQCSLDSAAFAACVSPTELTGLAPGAHTFAVRAVDLAGNPDGSPVVSNWTVTPVDTTAPQTTIGEGPSGSTAATTAAFEFSADEGGSTFECLLDGGAWAACTSPAVHQGLTPGAHTFQVRATDGAGNTDPTPASRTWTITAPPACTTQTVTLNAVADSWIDQGSPSSNKGTDSNLKVMSKSGSNLRALVRFDLPDLADGCAVSSATLRLNAASSRSGRTLQAIRVAAPWTESAVTWGNQPATTGTPATTASGSGWRTWTVTTQVTAMYTANAEHGFLIRDASENNDHEQQFRSRESGSNTPQLVLSIGPAPEPDTTAPQTTITTGPGASSTASFEFIADEQGTSFECSVDGGAWAACSSPKSLPGLAVGSAHTFAVRATDAAGNVDQTPATATWTVPIDCGAPITVPANADAWFEQASPSTNKGDDSALKVLSKSSNQNVRAAVRFALPAPPSGCEVVGATLRLYSDSAVSGRTLQAQRASAAWTETGINWGNQPAVAGAVATASSGTGWRTWTVTEQVLAMYAPGANHGFVLRDATEGASAGPEQSFHAREKGEHTPQLVVTFGASS